MRTPPPTPRQPSRSPRLEAFGHAFSDLVASFLPQQLDEHERLDALELFSQVERSMAAMAAMTASMMNDEGGNRAVATVMRTSSVQSRCARVWGVGRMRAGEMMGAGERLIAQPKVADEAVAGQLSFRQAELVTGAVSAEPGQMDFLLRLAKQGTPRRLARICRAVKANADERQAPSSAGAPQVRRSLRTWTSVDGQWHLSAIGTQEDGQQIMAAVRRALPWVDSAELADLGGRPLADDEVARAAMAGLVAAAGNMARGDEGEGAGLAGLGLPSWAALAAPASLLEVFDEIYGPPRAHRQRRSKYRLRTRKRRGRFPPIVPYAIKIPSWADFEWVHKQPCQDG